MLCPLTMSLFMFHIFLFRRRSWKFAAHRLPFVCLCFHCDRYVNGQCHVFVPREFLRSGAASDAFREFLCWKRIVLLCKIGTKAILHMRHERVSWKAIWFQIICLGMSPSILTSILGWQTKKKGSRKINEIVNNNWWRYDSVHNQSLRLIPSQAVNRMYPVRKNNQKRRLSMSSIGIARLSARCFVARERSLKGSRCATQDQGDVVITRCHNSL